MTIATPSDLSDVVDLLQRSGLPTSDLGDADPDDFRIVELATGADVRARRVAGCVAVETHGTHGLLRSLAVDASSRGCGLGVRLVEAAETLARARQLESLVLLTETAAPFFERLGYAQIDRSEAPGPIRTSSEFSSVCCCTSAVAMGKTLSLPTPEAPDVRRAR